MTIETRRVTLFCGTQIQERECKFLRSSFGYPPLPITESSHYKKADIIHRLLLWTVGVIYRQKVHSGPLLWNSRKFSKKIVSVSFEFKFSGFPAIPPLQALAARVKGQRTLGTNQEGKAHCEPFNGWI